MLETIMFTVESLFFELCCCFFFSSHSALIVLSLLKKQSVSETTSGELHRCGRPRPPPQTHDARRSFHWNMHKTQRMLRTRSGCFCRAAVSLWPVSRIRRILAEAASEQHKEQKYASCLRLKNKHQARTHFFSSSSLEPTRNSGLHSLSSVIYFIKSS